MAEFKAGDTVRIVKNTCAPYFDGLVGQTGVVAGVFDLEVERRFFPLDVTVAGVTLGFYDREVELATENFQ